MIHQTTWMAETFAADIAVVDFHVFVGMHYHMTFQTVQVWEGFVALLTLVRSVIFMHCLVMNFVVLFTGESFVTNFTQENLFFFRTGLFCYCFIFFLFLHIF